MKMRKMLNLLTLVALALGLIAAPVAAEPSGPDAPGDVYRFDELYVDPNNAQAGAHYIFIYKVAASVPKQSTLYTWFPRAMFDPDGDDIIVDKLDHSVACTVAMTETAKGCVVDCGGLYADIPDSDCSDSLIPNLSYPSGDTRLAQMNVAWASTKEGVFKAADWNTIPTTATVDSDPFESLGWQTKDWLDAGQVRVATPDAEVNEGYYVRVDFWGPPSINPSETANAGIKNPNTEDDYEYCVATDEEKVPVCLVHHIGAPQAVRLYRKRQVPLASCGYTYLDYVAGFDKIQHALDAANEIWLNTGDFTKEPMWNLFEGCPDLSGICETVGAAQCDPFYQIDRRFAPAVGLVIEVDADSNLDDVADVYAETLVMDTPGVILASMPTAVVPRAIIDAGAATVDGTHAVDITAGGITVGKVEIQTSDDGDGVAQDDELYVLRGFEIRNAITDSHGIKITTVSTKCVGSTAQQVGLRPIDVYSSTVAAFGTLDEGVNFKVYTQTTYSYLVFTQTSPIWLQNLSGAEGFGQIKDYAKLVNLSTGWSGHVREVDCGTTGAPGSGTRTCVELYGGGYYNAIEINDTRFADGNKVVIFQPTVSPNKEYNCPDARVDIRDNIIHDNDFDGIHAISVSVWVNENEVYENGSDGFYGKELKACNSLAICDGANRSDNMLDIEANTFRNNGDGSAADWLCADGRFDADPLYYDDYNDAGIDIESTNGSSLAACERLYIHDNDIYTNTHAGIWLQEQAAETGVRILWNDIRENGVFGVSSWALDNDYGTSPDTNPNWDEDPASDFFEAANGATGEVDVIFKYNDVLGNGQWGVKNWRYDWPTGPTGDLAAESGPLFNAKENYWNDEDCGGNGGGSPLALCPPGGPSAGPEPCAHMYDQRSDALGMGDAVDKGTFYNPWLTVPAFDEAEYMHALLEMPYQHRRVYGSDSLKLQAGWNTLAVPLALDSRAATIEKVWDAGYFLRTPDGDELVEMAYRYNAAADDWVALSGASYTLQPGEGYYIKLADDTRFPVLYAKTGIHNTDYALARGWNLIGSAFGIDRDNRGNDTTWDQGRYAVASPDLEKDSELDLEATKVVTEALADLTPSSVGDGAARVINPELTGQIENFWIETWVFGAATPAQTMYTGEGYWVYMRQDGWLGGFESAPLYFRAPLPDVE